MPTRLLAAVLRAPAAYLGRGCLALGLLALTAGAARAQTFASPVTYGAGNGDNPHCVAVADVNADGWRDIVTGNSGSVSVLLNNGAGTFASSARLPTSIGAITLGVAVADMDTDGKPDIVAVSYDTHSVSVLRGNGNGTFQPPTTYVLGTGGNALWAAVADVNADGKPDVVVACRSWLAVLLNDGAGTLTPAMPCLLGLLDARKVAIGDVDGDGKADLVASGAYRGGTGYPGAVGLLPGNGDGTFQALRTTFLPQNPNDLSLTDLNADSRLDVVTSGESNNNGSGDVLVQLGNGDGTFAPAISYASSSNSQTRSVAVADVSGDGKPDLLTANPGNHTVGLLKNTGNGTFAAGPSLGLGSSPYGVAIADVSNDGKPDIVTVHTGTYQVSVLLNTSAFLPARPPALAAEAAMYPNPTTTAATVFTAAGLPAEARSVLALLLDHLGRVVAQATAAASQGTARAELPTTGLAPGLYVLRATAHDAQGLSLGALPTRQLRVR